MTVSLRFCVSPRKTYSYTLSSCSYLASLALRRGLALGSKNHLFTIAQDIKLKCFLLILDICYKGPASHLLPHRLTLFLYFACFLNIIEFILEFRNIDYSPYKTVYIFPHTFYKCQLGGNLV